MPIDNNFTWADIRSNSLHTKNAASSNIDLWGDDPDVDRSVQNTAPSQAVTGTPGQGAQFVYIAATVANILTSNMSQVQINLLANFMSVVTTCIFAILTVESPTDVLGD